MFPAASLLTVLLLALSITGSPIEIPNSPITLPIVKRLITPGGTGNVLLQRDKTRIAALRHPSTRGHASSTPVETDDVAYYIAAVGVGSPPTTYNLIVDTGSSNTWIGASTTYKVTRTSSRTGQPVEVDYGSGSFSGMEYLDTVTLGSGLTITNQSIGVATSSSGFTGVDGVLGIGPADLTESTLQNLPTTAIPTVTDKLYNEYTIPHRVVGVFFEPSTSKTDIKGALTFGGADTTKYTGDIAYTHVTTTKPASTYWGIDESITYGSTTIMSSTSGIVDTGTNFIFLATDAFNKYQTETGAILDKATGCLTVTSAKYAALKNLDFHIGKETYSLTPNAQIWPRSLNSQIGGRKDIIYLIVSDFGAPSGQGFDFVNGYPFLQRFYSVFDSSNSRIGFAKTSFTDATTN
ncbi:acid protease [Suillus decipiens]|nr:acid protease [Suillus decipiens]